MAESIRRSYREFVGAVADVLDDLNSSMGLQARCGSRLKYGEPAPASKPSTIDHELTLAANNVLNIDLIERARRDDFVEQQIFGAADASAYAWFKFDQFARAGSRLHQG